MIDKQAKSISDDKPKLDTNIQFNSKDNFSAVLTEQINSNKVNCDNRNDYSEKRSTVMNSVSNFDIVAFDHSYYCKTVTDDKLNNCLEKSIDNGKVYNSNLEMNDNTSIKSDSDFNDINDNEVEIDGYYNLENTLLSGEQKIKMLPTCFQDALLPDKVKLSLIIFNLANLNGISSFDKNIVPICLLALKNFMKNLLTELIISHNSSFLITNNGINLNSDQALINPFSQNDLLFSMKRLGTKFENGFKNGQHSIFNLKKRKKFGLNRNELIFTTDDQVEIFSSDKKSIPKFRSSTSILHIPKMKNKMNDSLNLYHLFELLKNNRSIIPVTSIWYKAFLRTISAINNVPEDEDIIDPKKYLLKI